MPAEELEAVETAAEQGDVEAILNFAARLVERVQLLQTQLGELENYAPEETQTLLKAACTLEETGKQTCSALRQIHAGSEASSSGGDARNGNGHARGGHGGNNGLSADPAAAEFSRRKALAQLGRSLWHCADDLRQATQNVRDDMARISRSPQPASKLSRDRLKMFARILTSRDRDLGAVLMAAKTQLGIMHTSERSKSVAGSTDSRSSHHKSSSCGSQPSSRSSCRLRKSKKHKHQSLGRPHYSCDALSGIDEASVEGKRQDGALACVFCSRRFVCDDETAPHRLGAHLVRAHSFGLCNLNCTFGRRADFLRHLRSFHGWSRDDAASDVLVDRLFLRSHFSSSSLSSSSRSSSSSTRRRLGRKLLALEDGSAQPWPGHILGEREESGLLNLLVLNEILQVVGLKVDISSPPPSSLSSNSSASPAPATLGVDPAETTLAHDLCVALSKLDRLLLLQNGPAAGAGTSSATSTAPPPGPSGQGVNGAGAEVGRRDVERLMHHAACVQQELAIENCDELLRQEGLYSADQYRIDDLACKHLPQPPERRVWRVAVPDVGGLDQRRAIAEQTVEIQDPKVANMVQGLPPSSVRSPFRSFRDAVRQLGRAHMVQSGDKSYVAIMPQLLRAASLVLRQEPSLSRQRAGRVDERLLEPLTEENLGRLDEQHCGAESISGVDDVAERRLSWMTDPSLDWWFFGMLKSSPSFRRLVRGGRALRHPPSDSATSSSKNRKDKHRSGAKKIPKLAPYDWANVLLASLGAPQPSSSNGIDKEVGTSVNGEPNGGEGSLMETPNGGTMAPGVPELVVKQASPAVSLIGADHGSNCSSEDSLEAHDAREEEKVAENSRMRQKREEKGKGVDRPPASRSNGVAPVTPEIRDQPVPPTNQDEDDDDTESEEESSEEEDDDGSSTWESSP